MVTAVKPHQLDAALRILLRPDRIPLRREAWPDIVDVAARVILAADDDVLRQILFGAGGREPASLEPFSVRDARPLGGAVTIAGATTWTAGGHSRTPSLALTPAFETVVVPTERSQRLPRGSLLLLSCGAVLAITGLNLLFGPAARLIQGAGANPPPDLLGELMILGGIAACAWAGVHWTVLRSYGSNNTGRAPKQARPQPARAMGWGLPLACALVLVALGLSIAAAMRPQASATPPPPLAARAIAAPQPVVPAAAVPPASASATGPAAGDAPLAQSSAGLIRDVTRRVTTMARPADPPPLVSARTAPQAGQQESPTASTAASQPADSTFTRVSDASAGDTLAARPAQVVNPAPGHIRLAPPPTPRATPAATAPRLGPVLQPGLPPQVATVPAATATAPTVRH